MEAQLEDIRHNITLNTMKALRKSIIDCTKNIKSNDETFNISTLPHVSDKLISLMGDYIDAVHRIESCQNVFLKVHEEVEAIENDENNKDPVELNLMANRFNYLIDEQNKATTTNEIEAQLELDAILKPFEDEEIRVEAPAQQVPKDPITKRDVVVAVKSTCCGHIYDKEAIEDYFTQQERAKKTVRCPVAGCTNRSMKRKELYLDEETNKLIQSL